MAPAEGYGEIDPGRLQEVPKQLIPPDALKVGAQLVAQTQDGHTVPVMVAEIKDDTVIISGNHPLAGKTLHFDVKVLDVKQAQAEPKN